MCGPNLDYQLLNEYNVARLDDLDKSVKQEYRSQFTYLENF